LRAARAWLATQSPKALQEFNRARSTFFNRPGSGKYKAPVYASRAIIEAVGAVNHSFPLDCVLRAALHLRKAEAYARAAMSTPELRRRLKAYWAEYDRVKALRRQILEAAREDDDARFEFFCDYGYPPPLILPP
jgi:hypothetical protein